MSNKLLTKNWLVYIIINQIIQFTYLLDAFFWYDHILILYFYIIAISLLNSFCYVVEIYNLENNKEVHKVILSCLYTTWFLIFETNFENLLFIPLTQLVVIWIFVNYIFCGYQDKKIKILKISIYIFFLCTIYTWLINYSVFLVLYQALMVLMLIVPVLIVPLKKNMLNKYGIHIKNKIKVLIVLSCTLLVEVLVCANKSIFYLRDIDYDLYIITMLMFLLYIAVRDLKFSIGSFKNLLFEVGIIFRIVFWAITLLFCFIFFNREYMAICSIVCILFFLISLQIHILCNLEKKYHYLDYELLYDSSYFDWYIKQLQKVQEHDKLFAEFLHDEILQDIIYLKNRITINQEKMLSTDDNQFILSLINKIRNTVDSYSPLIIKSISLKENYKNLIKSMQQRYSKNDIIIDFYCDKDFFLEKPYDILIYRIMKELLNNAFKHSNAELIELRLYLNKRSDIVLSIKNDGCEKGAEYKIGWGTNSLEEDVRNIGGKIVLNQYANGIVLIIVEIPLLGDQL